MRVSGMTFGINPRQQWFLGNIVSLMGIVSVANSTKAVNGRD